jgi:beta-alanine degradation protein BauB
MRHNLRAALGFSFLLIALAASSSTAPVETERVPQFENAHVKVWKSVVLPDQPLPPHRHEHGRVIIALQGGKMKITETTGASETQVWETGKAYWLPANLPGTLHSDVNVGDKPIEVMVVEAKDDNQPT